MDDMIQNGDAEETWRLYFSRKLQPLLWKEEY